MINLDLRERADRIQSLLYSYETQPKTELTRCPLSGTDRFVILTHVDRYGFPAQSMINVDSGLVSLNPRMTREAYGEFYKSVYRPLVSAFHGRLIDAKTIQDEQRRYAQSMIQFVRPHLGPEFRTMLDVGGSTGVVSAEFAKAFEIRPTVIDPAPDETAQAAELGIENITAFIEDWNPQGKKFDLAALFQTVDHLLDAKATLTKMHDVLEPHGLLVVDIVDFRAAYLRNNSVEAAIKIDHVYSFSQETFEAMLAQVGFQWIRKDFAADHLHVGYVCRKVPPTPGILPSTEWINSHLQELRYIQNHP